METERSGLEPVIPGAQEHPLPAAPARETNHETSHELAGDLNAAPFARSGFVAVMNRCIATCPFCSKIGCLHESERPIESLIRVLDSTREAGLGTVTFPPNTLLYPQRERILPFCQERRLKPVLRIHPGIGVSAHSDAIADWVFQGGELEALWDGAWPKEDIEFLRRLETVVDGRLRVLVMPLLGSSVVEMIDSLPSAMRQRAEFFFPLKSVADEPFYGCDEIHEQLSELKRLRPDFEVRPYRGYDAPDRGAPSWFEPEPEGSPLLVSASLNPRPEISVIVPTLNRKENVINTLRHLQRQDLDADLFEVLIIDDGSDDGTTARIREHLARSPMRFNLRYYFLQRPLARRRGDDLYRAGIARNFGVRKSVGNSLVFLDSDVLVSPDFLSDIRTHHLESDVLQYERVQIPFKKSSQRPRYQDLDPKRDGIRTKNGFWERFYEANDWQSLPMHWLYVTTACLVVRRSHFQQVGGFARAFRSYGFEGTLLGWQLARLNLKWRVRRKPVFHLKSSDEDSEYGNSRLRKQIVMSRSAKLFYSLTLDETFYSVFFPLLGNWTRTRIAMSLMSRSLLGRWLLRPLHFVVQAWFDPEAARSGLGRSLRRGSDHAETVARKLVADPMRSLWIASGQATRAPKWLESSENKENDKNLESR